MSNSNNSWLPAGVSLEQLAAAIKRSGYPLQSVVAGRLRGDFMVQEEWGFLDRISGDYRTIDVMADYYDWSAMKDERVRAHGTLIVECKRSDLPFVFFRCDPGSAKPAPVVAGLRHDLVELKTDDSRSTWSLPVLDALGLLNDDFIVNVQTCATFSKVVRKGKELELSGSDVYNGIVQPLMSAVAHFQAASKPVDTAFYFDAHLTVPVAVIDAPMVGVGLGEEPNLEPLQWVRILRHEPENLGKFGAHHGRLSGVDVVSSDYFEKYVREHFLPFYEKFRGNALRHGIELASGKGFVPRIEGEGLGSLNERLRPR